MHNKQILTNKLLLTSLILVILLLMTILYFLLADSRDNSDTLSRQTESSESILNSITSQAASFNPLIPTSLPNTYNIDQSTIAYDQDVLIYQVSSSNGATVTISQQKLPEDFRQQTLESSDTFSTSYGTASVNLLADGRTTVNVFSDSGLLVLFNTTDPIQTDDMKTIVRSLSLN